jgi:arylsulfatase A-like enzyme
MKNKKLFPLFLSPLLLMAVSMLSSCSSSKKTASTISASGKLPNIIFILADDLGYGDVGCYGQQLIQTPNIDRLARSGMRFTDFYAGSTVCAPSRASLMTGRHTGHVSVRGNGEVPLPATDSILPQVLKQKGYVNGMVGKWGLGLKETSGVPERKGWDFFAGHLHHVEGHYQKPDSAWQMINGASTKIKLPEGMYANEWFNQSALQFIRQNQNNPFFLYVSYTLPHAELNVPGWYLQQYLNADGSSKFAPEVAQPSGQHYGPQPYPKAAYAAMVTQMDDYIGNIMDLLKNLQLEENTLVIFASDNGTHVEGGRKLKDVTDFFKSSGPLKGTKRDLYEGGIRIPFIASWKGQVPAGTTSAFTGAFWDVLPTFAELTGTKPPAGDGVSFLQVLLGKKESVKPEPLYWEFYEGGFKQAVRKHNWKAIRFYKGKVPVRTELYDLSTDIGEKNDLAAQHHEIVKELEKIMEEERVPSANPLFQIK